MPAARVVLPGTFTSDSYKKELFSVSEGTVTRLSVALRVTTATKFNSYAPPSKIRGSNEYVREFRLEGVAEAFTLGRFSSPSTTNDWHLVSDAWDLVKKAYSDGSLVSASGYIEPPPEPTDEEIRAAAAAVPPSAPRPARLRDFVVTELSISRRPRPAEEQLDEDEGAF